MIWLVAGSYAAAGVLFLSGLGLRLDPRLQARIAGGPHPRRGLLRSLGALLRLPRARARLRERLPALAGDEAGMDRVVGAKASLAAAGATLGLTSWPRGPVAALGAAIVLVVAGYRLPEFRLARQAARRRARASARVPDLLDLVAISVTAGLTPRLALERASEVVSGPLAIDLDQARRQVALGAPWRSALRDVATRAGLPDLRRLAVILERGERLGAPVATRLRALAREVRAERRAADEERARRAPVAMLFPLVFLILPAFVLAAVVPAVLTATRGL
jgi:tight adherence protein C